MKIIYTYMIRIVLVLNVILMMATGYLYMNKDRRGPEIIFEGTKLYYDGVNEQLLLMDVRAVDLVDGDVSDTLRIKAFMETEKEIIVTYLAKDKSNNITESSRHFDK